MKSVQRTAASEEALLYEENFQGYNGANYLTGRRWVPLFDGVPTYNTTDSSSAIQDSCRPCSSTLPSVNGALPAT